MKIEDLLKDGYKYTTQKTFLYKKDESDFIQIYLAGRKRASLYYCGDTSLLPAKRDPNSLEDDWRKYK